MDYTERHITKIAREAAKLAAQTMKEDGVGPAEYDFIYTVRHHPGITQAELREQLGIDKGAAARRAARLEANAGKGQVLISDEVYERLKDRIEVDAVGEIPLKGKSRNVFVYSLKAIKGKEDEQK